MSAAALVEHLRDLAEPAGGLSFKRMFGGVGLFRDGRMCGLIAADVVYLKCDAATAPRFEAEGLEPFSYGTRKGEVRVMDGYRRLPERALDDPQEFADWLLPAIEVARRAEGKRKGGAARPRSKAKA